MLTKDADGDVHEINNRRRREKLLLTFNFASLGELSTRQDSDVKAQLLIRCLQRKTKEKRMQLWGKQPGLCYEPNVFISLLMTALKSNTR